MLQSFEVRLEGSIFNVLGGMRRWVFMQKGDIFFVVDEIRAHEECVEKIILVPKYGICHRETPDKGFVSDQWAEHVRLLLPLPSSL